MLLNLLDKMRKEQDELGNSTSQLKHNINNLNASVCPEGDPYFL